jgi:hypothetical protein
MKLDPQADLAGYLSKRFKQIASESRSEEDLRIGIESELTFALETLGIAYERPHYEVMLLQGRADAVYGHAIIEYEKPGKLRTKPGYRETTGQLTQMLGARALQLNPVRPVDELRRMIGISIDGESILFCQHRSESSPSDERSGLTAGQLSLLPTHEVIEGFDIRGPYEVTPASMTLMLGCLRAMSRPALTAKALGEVFGPQGVVARTLVSEMYRVLEEKSTPKSLAFFEEWRRLFGIIYGEASIRTSIRSQELAEAYGVHPDADFPRLLFGVHTYFALLMKLIAVELLALQKGRLIAPFVRDVVAVSESELNHALQQLESGDVFRSLGISNFVEGDFFQWYLHPLDPQVGSGIRILAERLSKFEAPTAIVQPERAEDLLKNLYQDLIPKSLRHDLGEYYTPDWLAEYVTAQSGYEGQQGQRVLDPSCGSGTFLVHFIQVLRRRCLDEGVPLEEAVELVLGSVVGFDINPLAVIAARTNYLLALGDLVRHSKPFDIPVYFADSILAPSKLTLTSTQLNLDQVTSDNLYQYRSVVGVFGIPAEVVESGKTGKLADLMEQSLAVRYEPEEFAMRAMGSLGLTGAGTQESLRTLFQELTVVDERGVNGVWARILKNAVAPLGTGTFDFVIGNPPWIQWEDLAPEYRVATASLWTESGLEVRGEKGKRFALGKTKRDFSMLFAYFCSRMYLKADGGVLGFLITQTVMQSGTGAVFRNFRTPEGLEFRVRQADDFVEVQPFDATNWSAAIIWETGAETKYPVPYVLWKKATRRKVPMDVPFADAESRLERVNLEAEPLNQRDRNSPWLIAKKGAHAHVRKLQGDSSYSGAAGIVTWLDGAYWRDVLEKRPDGNLIVENLNDAGKTKLKKVRVAIEPDLLCPFVPWPNIKRWRVVPSHSILVPHSKETGYLPIPEREMREKYPLTLEFLYRFKDSLEKRSGYRQLRQGKGFYILGNSGTNFWAKHRVVWRSMGTEVRAAPLLYRDWFGYHKPDIHKNTANFIVCSSEEEVLYVCGMLNASFITAYAIASSSRGSKALRVSVCWRPYEYPPTKPSLSRQASWSSLVRLWLIRVQRILMNSTCWRRQFGRSAPKRSGYCARRRMRFLDCHRAEIARISHPLPRRGWREVAVGFRKPVQGRLRAVLTHKSNT